MEIAPSPNALENTLAPYVVKRSIMPNPAPLRSSFLPIVTPFIADTKLTPGNIYSGNKTSLTNFQMYHTPFVMALI